MRDMVLIKGVVAKGLFRGEKAVTLETRAGERSLLTYEDSIEEIDGRQYLRVELLDEDDEVLLVLLPDEIIGGGRAVTVSRDLRHVPHTASAG